MKNFLPLDLIGTIHEGLRESKRANDGLLHCSSDLVGSLRHTMLRLAGAPELETDIVSDIILETGTLWHKRIAELLVKSGAAFMQEIRVNPWLPKGWGGTADWLFWHPEYNAFVLGDLKTTQGEGIAYIERDGIKTEHHHQLSAYWHALSEAGFPLLDTMLVCYFPKNRAKGYDTRPIELEVKPLDRDYIFDLMNERRAECDVYLASLWGFDHDVFISDMLAPPIERQTKVIWNKGKYEVKLVPHWTAQFCPYPDSLCDCNTQGETKIGAYTYEGKHEDGISDIIAYRDRAGYKDIVPPALTKQQRSKLIEYSR